MALKNCIECGKELGSKVAKCPHCGTDQRNWFMRHKILTFIGVIILLSIIGSLSGGGEVDEASNPVTVSSDEKTDEKTVSYGNGTYLVGKDIQSGLYKVTVTDKLTKMGYIEKLRDLNMDLNSIIANTILTGDGYIEIKDTDYAIKLQGVKISPIDLNTLTPNIKTEVSNGVYLISFDIKPGMYKVEVTDNLTGMGYVERVSSVSLGMYDIIANEIYQGQGYINVKESDFAITVQGAKLTLQE